MLLEAIVTLRWVQKVQCDWELNVVICSLKTSLKCPWAFPQYLPGIVLQLQTLIFSFIIFTLVTVKLEVCSKFSCYFGLINTHLDTDLWKFMTESRGTWFQIMPLYLPETGIQVPAPRKQSPKKPVIPAVIHTNVLQNLLWEPKKGGNILRKLCLTVGHNTPAAGMHIHNSTVLKVPSLVYSRCDFKVASSILRITLHARWTCCLAPVGSYFSFATRGAGTTYQVEKLVAGRYIVQISNWLVEFHRNIWMLLVNTGFLPVHIHCILCTFDSNGRMRLCIT
jgi:hypothetical protein